MVPDAEARNDMFTFPARSKQRQCATTHTVCLYREATRIGATRQAGGRLRHPWSIRMPTSLGEHPARTRGGLEATPLASAPTRAETPTWESPQRPGGRPCRPRLSQSCPLLQLPSPIAVMPRMRISRPCKHATGVEPRPRVPPLGRLTQVLGAPQGPFLEEHPALTSSSNGQGEPRPEDTASAEDG